MRHSVRALRVAMVMVGLTGLAPVALADVICNSQSAHTNMRAGPSARDFPVVRQLRNGDAVQVLGEVQNAAGGWWLRVRLNGGQTGFVTRPAVAARCGAGNGPVAAAAPQPPAGAQNFVVPGACYPVWAIVGTKAEAEAVVRRYHEGQEGMGAYVTRDGRYAVSTFMKRARPVNQDGYNVHDYFARYIRSGKLPAGAHCNDGKTFVRKTDWNFDYITKDRTQRRPGPAETIYPPAALGLAGKLLGGILGAAGSAARAGAGGGASAPAARYTYTLSCREQVVGPDNWRKGPSASCAGDRYTCERQLENSINAQYGSLTQACARLFGSGFTASGIDQN